MKKICIFGLFVVIFLCVSCKKTEIHLHDRHVLSYELVKSYAQKHGSCTLVLLDYHHDILPRQETLTSVNWAGRLVEEGLVSKIVWLSGRTLLLPNRNSRMAWLERSLQGAYPDTAEKIRAAVELVDWHDLQTLRLKEPFVVTLDFDVFTKDPGDDPAAFVDELCAWIQAQKPQLVTLAFSASYQPNAQAAWSWLARFADGWHTKTRWFLESGDFGEQAESNDDTRALSLWNAQVEHFRAYAHSLYRGAYLWLCAPQAVQTALRAKHIQSGNEATEPVLAAWNADSLATLHAQFDEARLAALSQTAVTALRAVWNGARFPYPMQHGENDGAETVGVAVRFKNAYIDRGCLSLYTGITQEHIVSAVQYCAQEAASDSRYAPILPQEADELATNISIFGEWQQMSHPLDFTPGRHSLLVEDISGERTLLQAAIALEREYSHEQFLSRLVRKAGLGEDAWKNPELRFYKADTISYTSYRSDYAK